LGTYVAHVTYVANLTDSEANEDLLLHFDSDATLLPTAPPPGTSLGEAFNAQPVASASRLHAVSRAGGAGHSAYLPTAPSGNMQARPHCNMRASPSEVAGSDGSADMRVPSSGNGKTRASPHGHIRPSPRVVPAPDRSADNVTMDPLGLGTDVEQPLGTDVQQPPACLDVEQPPAAPHSGLTSDSDDSASEFALSLAAHAGRARHRHDGSLVDSRRASFISLARVAVGEASPEATPRTSALRAVLLVPTQPVRFASEIVTVYFFTLLCCT